jgi:hypothetical protein
VPDERIPEGKGVRILCPKCRTSVERADSAPTDSDTGKAEYREQYSHTEPAPKSLSGSSADPESSAAEDDQDNDFAMEVVEEGVKTALVCISDDSRTDMVAGVLKQLDFYVSTARTARPALARLSHNRYDMVIVDEIFDGSKPSDNLLLHHIQLLPMHVRRSFFMCLMSEVLPSLDRFLAFRMGVDVILNTSDLEKLKIVLVREMKDHSNFYRAYNDELVRKGHF